VLIVSDDNVDCLYGDAWQTRLEGHGLDVSRAVVPAGESTKQLPHVRELYDRALEAGLDRRSLLVALGGGMVGDLAGFVAATYLRGIRFVQVPTSLLAMVDSSVGGKTGVNLEQGKNLVGVFYQPVEVVADLATLRTLPDDEYVSGLAEVIKYGVIWDAELFSLLEGEADRVAAREPAVLETIVKRCCEIKAEVVAVDERESGVRAILNYGHTVGHAIEQVSGYGRWLHGQAVSLGMVYAGELSRRVRGLDEGEQRRVTALLERVGLPVSGVDAAWPELRKAVDADKKTRGRVPRFVLADRIGSVAYGCEVDEDVMEETYKTVFGE